MRKHLPFGIASVAIALAIGGSGRAQDQPPERTHVRKSEVGGRLAPSDQQYASIAGAHLKGYVEELAAISRRYRDNGHPQFWGRIIGTEADAENARWMLEKFRRLGMADVREQAIDLAPQWMPQSWSVVASAGGKTLRLETAQPTYLAVGTPADGLDLEAVYAGLGSDADLALSRGVRGNAVFFYSTDLTSRHVGISGDAIRRMGERGAAAIFVILGIPGNLRTQFYPVNSKVPTFSLGQQDGLAMRDLIASQTAGEPPRVRIRLDVRTVPNLKTSTVWGSLPGTTDETVFVVAHRDGWFEAANDNGTGVATMIGLAEYFAKIPAAQRRRTITFLGTTGHHNSGANSGVWFAEHPEIFAKAALIINSEHTGAMQTNHVTPRGGNAPGLSTWYATGPRVADIVVNALDAFGVPTYPESGARPAGEIGRYFQFAPSVQVMSSGFVWHSDHETPATISTTLLEAVTRAYARIIVDVNAVSLKELRAPLGGQSTASTASQIEQHRAAAQAAAAQDHSAIHGTLCVNSVEPAYSARQDAPRAPAAAAQAPAPPASRTMPPRSEWYAEPVKVFDNLYFVGQSAYSSWAVNTSEGIILIDVIFDYSVEAEVADGLRKLGLDPARIKYVIISHGHGDHHGGAKFLQEKFGARIIMSAADWDLVERNTRDPRPKRDMVATDGQKVTLGGTDVTLYLTPGHTPGTISTLVPVSDGGRRHMAVAMGGTGFNFTITKDKPRLFWYRTYIESVERLRGIAAKAGADVLIANHTALDSSTVKLPALAKRRPGDRHPYVIGTAAVQRYMTVAAECARANLLALTS